ncbi:hypothetical protein PM082_002232 [Marasmius tenuissimus]|nr:hypothetical protein PM082_002232 [Marasmius tenuissimus]
MPRVKTEKRNEPRGSSQCTICHVVISNKTDMPRHMKIHSENRDKLMHRCPYPDCKFENLQKSNVETHIRTHTKAKTERCPDCDFSTVDPGSLTRHRKRIHGYVPKARRSRQPPPPKTQILSVAGPSSSSTSTTRPFEDPPQQPSSSHDPSQSRRQTSSSSSYPRNPHTPRAQEPYHEHRLPKYDPQPPHQVQLPPIRFIPQPHSGSSSFSFSATAPFATRSPSPRPIVLPPLQPPQTHMESECTPKVKTAPSRRRAMDF